MSMSTIRKSTRVRKPTSKQLEMNPKKESSGNSSPGQILERDFNKDYYRRANDNQHGDESVAPSTCKRVMSNSDSKSSHLLTNKLGHSCKRLHDTELDSGNEKPNKLARLGNKEQQKQQQQDEEDNDRIDPVEKLLSLNYINQGLTDANDVDSHSDNDSDDDNDNGNDSDSDNDNDSDSDEEYDDTDSSDVDFNNDINKYNKISLNFSKILNDNLLKCYSNTNKSPIDFYNDNSSFALLNKQQYSNPYHYSYTPSSGPITDSCSNFTANDYSREPQPINDHNNNNNNNDYNNNFNSVPFFRAVNFNPKPKSKTHIFDEIISLDDEVDPKDGMATTTATISSNNNTITEPTTNNYETIDPKAEINTNSTENFTHSGSYPTLTSYNGDSDEEITTPNNSPLLSNSKMCFHYRQYDNLNLSNLKPQPSNLRILNENSILSGKASETIGSGNFLINDFFL